MIPAFIRMAALGVAITFLPAASGAQTGPGPMPGPMPAKAQTCLGCHDGALKFGTPAVTAPRLVRQQAEYIASTLRQYRSGQRSNEVMRAVAASLNDREIIEVAEYFGGVRPAPVRPAPGSVMPKIVKQVCENCHGMTGVATLPESPIIGGQHEDYLRQALESFRAGSRRSAVMGPVARMLSDEEIVEAARYYADVADYFKPPLPEEIAANATARLPPPKVIAPARHKPGTPLSRAGQKAAAERIAASIEMVTLPNGAFLMGSPADEGDAPGLPRHGIDIRSFRMARHLVTFAQFDAFTRATGRPLIDAGGMPRGNYPAINTSMADIRAFVEWLNSKTGRKFRLPSESEWEYAARAGTTTHYWWGDKVDFTKYNSFRNEGPDVWPGTSPVGAFPPNPFGLYDMAGNVFQRVSDCRRPTYEGKPADGSPVVGEPCVLKVMRGGSWRNLSGAARHATRSGVTDDLTSTSIGFRLAEDL